MEIIPRAAVEKWKRNTYDKYGNSALIIENWGEERGTAVLGISPTLSEYLVICYYNDRVDEGEGVAPNTADKELTVMALWFENLSRHRPELASRGNPVKHQLVKDLQKRAHMLYQHRPAPKKGLPIELLQKLFINSDMSGDWKWDHTRLATGIMFFFMARSIAAAHVVWRGDHRGPIAHTESDVSWNTNKKYGRYVRVDVMKDKTIKGKEASHRFLPADNGSDINFSEYIRNYIRHYHIPDGTFLLAARRADGSFHNTKFTNWSRVVSQVCAFLHIDRENHGTQSFRRGCAEWLNECGLDFEDVGLLGFWLSDVVRRYTGTQSNPRMAAWAKLH